MDINESLSRSKSSSQKKKQRRTKGKKIRTILSFVLLIVMIGVVSTFVYGYWKIDQALNKMSVPASNTATAAGSEPEINIEEDTKKPFAVAIIGTDNRAGSGGTLNTDVIMVAVVNPSEHNVHLLSIPRDTKVKIPGLSGYRKANSAYAWGESERKKQERKKADITISGISVAKEMLSDYLQIPIRSYITVDFKGFEEVVDAVGGVTVDVKKSMQYDSKIDNTHINLSRGEQTLDGKKALDYVRHRLDKRGTNYQSSDFDRNERQQEVIKALVKKIVSFEGVTSLTPVLDAVASNTTTNLSVDQMKELMWDFKSFSPERVYTIENEAYWDSKQSFTVIPEERLEQIRVELKELLQLQ